MNLGAVMCSVVEKMEGNRGPLDVILAPAVCVGERGVPPGFLLLSNCAIKVQCDLKNGLFRSPKPACEDFHEQDPFGTETGLPAIA
jgi:hypothetical protein